MSDSSPPNPQKALSISGSTLENVQIGGIAGRDQSVTQVQGEVCVTNVFCSIGVDPSPVAPAQPLNRQEYRWRQVLLEKVKQYWIDGVLEQSLHSKVMIELGLEERSDAVKRPLSGVEEFPVKSGQVFDEGTAATDIFDQMGAGRTLLILGNPGSGKTTTLLKLAQSLVARSEVDLSQPIPVVLNLSSWADKQLPMDKWLVEALRDIYGASRTLGKKWVKHEELILLLDGLDEVAAKCRNDCVKALNRLIHEHGLTEMVVCCRFQDYEALSERLMLRSAIYVQPLTSQQINLYLEQSGVQLEALKAVLKENAEMEQFSSSPLILSIMSLAYQGLSVEELPQPRVSKAWLRHLFDMYIERMLQRRGTQQKYSALQSKRWLIWIARQMLQSSQTFFLIERLQPTWLPSQSKRVIYKILCTLILGLSSGIYYGLLFGLNSLRTSPDNWLRNGLLYGVFFGLFNPLFYMLIENTKFINWSWERVKKNFLSGLTDGLLFGLITSLSYFMIIPVVNGGSELFFKVLAGIIVGLQTGIFSGLIFGILFGLLSIMIGAIPVIDIQKISDKNQEFWKPSFIRYFRGIFGLLRLPLTECSDIETFETIKWSWKEAKRSSQKGLAGGLFCGLFFGLVTVPISILYLIFDGEVESYVSQFGEQGGLIIDLVSIGFNGLVYGIIYGLLFSLIFCLLGGLIGGVRGPKISESTIPNQGILKTVINTLIVALTIALSIGFPVVLIGNLFQGINFGLMGGFIAGLICGGFAYFRHFTLRLILTNLGNIPWNYARFLDYAADSLFLQKVGGGYIFVHRMLLEHFAQMELSQGSTVVVSQETSNRVSSP